MPGPTFQPKLRIFFLLLEATFSYAFWTMRTPKNDYGMSHICLWNREDLEYDGICSHCSLNEGVRGDFSLSPERLEAFAAERRENHQVKNRVRSSDYHYKQMHFNRDEYLDDMAQRNKESIARDPEHHAAVRSANTAAHRVKKT